LNNIAIQYRCFPIFWKDCNLLGLGLIVSKHLDAPAPGCLLTVIDFTQIKHLSLHHPITGNPPVLDNAPVAVFFTVFETLFTPQEHAESVSGNAPKLNGQSRHYSGFGKLAVREIRDLVCFRVQYSLKFTEIRVESAKSG
jgi:hypothetical protein